MQHSSEHLLQKWIRHYWWVAICMAVACVVYTASRQQKERIMASLDQQVALLQQAKKTALEEQQDLVLQIDSQSDPAWVELTLMKVLGLVPEGYSKVYFYTENPSPSLR